MKGRSTPGWICYPGRQCEVQLIGVLTPRATIGRRVGPRVSRRLAPSTMLRMVPLPRRLAAGRIESFDDRAGLILPCNAGEGDRPKDGGRGGEIRAGSEALVQSEPPSRRRPGLNPASDTFA